MPSQPSKAKPKPSLHFEALGTAWEIAIPGGIDAALEANIHTTLERIDQTWSRFRTDSMVTQMSRQAGHYPLTPEDYDLLSWYHKLYAATGGSLTPLVGQTLSDAGYDATYSLSASDSITATPTWEDCLQLSPKELTVLKPVLLDVGAAGKGWAIDQVAPLLGDAYIIDAGGDIRAHGQTETIGLENPHNPGEVIGTVTLANGSLCGSASNRRAWGQHGEWHHIIDPQTSRPVQDVVATWAITDTAMAADGLATALFFVPPEQLASLGSFRYIVLYANGSVIHSADESIQLFTV